MVFFNIIMPKIQVWFNITLYIHFLSHLMLRKRRKCSYGKASSPDVYNLRPRLGNRWCVQPRQKEEPCPCDSWITTEAGARYSAFIYSHLKRLVFRRVKSSEKVERPKLLLGWPRGREGGFVTRRQYSNIHYTFIYVRVCVCIYAFINMYCICVCINTYTVYVYIYLYKYIHYIHICT